MIKPTMSDSDLRESEKMQEKHDEDSVSLLTRLLYPTHLKRFLFFFLIDTLIIIFSLYISFYIRFEFAMPGQYQTLFLRTIPFFIAVKLIAIACFRLYKITWRYVGLHDLLNVISAVAVSEAVLLALVWIPVPSFPSFVHPHIVHFWFKYLYTTGFPRSIFFIDGFISFILLGGLRISKRLFFEVIHKKGVTKTGKRTIIIGAGNTGEMVLRDIARQGFGEYYPVVFLDDDKNKIGMYVRGLKVFGSTKQLNIVIERYEAEALIIAIPSLNYKALREIYDLANKSKVGTVKIVPRIYDVQRPSINMKDLEDIKIEDLLGRQVVQVDYKAIEDFVENKVVLVTGAGGSIGSEIVVQICSFMPEKVILFDNDETDLHNMKLRLERMFPNLVFRQWEETQLQEKVVFITGDIRDDDAVQEVFSIFKPHIVFHAAAYKHVPMMEYNPKEAVKINMFGTHKIAQASVQHKVEKFIMISTDKAVRPTSIMGATKRIAEYICRVWNGCGDTAFVSVRFGNVLGSRGSVLPVFLEQLKHGGPIKVTHKDMQRYFMTIPEAVSLVLQASVIGAGGEVLVLDMGEPVRIVNLAEELIRIHGMEPYRDIQIEFVGLRPGEKLFEEILTAEEGTSVSKHKKIFIAKNSEYYSKVEIEKILEEFETLMKTLPRKDNKKIRGMLKKYVKYYEGNE